ncbi:hypothetical protein Mapa_005158 [Marchantia paleacea]|nr:hypothetical protein Mapa_005158 [Marchantia paleacea]
MVQQTAGARDPPGELNSRTIAEQNATIFFIFSFPAPFVPTLPFPCLSPSSARARKQASPRPSSKAPSFDSAAAVNEAASISTGHAQVITARFQAELKTHPAVGFFSKEFILSLYSLTQAFIPSFTLCTAEEQQQQIDWLAAEDFVYDSAYSRTENTFQPGPPGNVGSHLRWVRGASFTARRAPFLSK